MTKPVPNEPARKVLYTLAVHNVDGTTGLHVGICRETEIDARVERYMRKICNRQIRRDFQTVEAFGEVHVIEGTRDRLLELRQEFLGGRTTCPGCLKNLIRKRRGINSVTQPCHGAATATLH